MFKIVEEKKIGGSSKIFLKKIAIEKKKLPKLRQNHDLQSNTSRWTDRQKCWNSGYYWSLMVDKCGNSHFIWFFIDLDKKSASNSSKHRWGAESAPPRTVRRLKSPDFLGLISQYYTKGVIFLLSSSPTKNFLNSLAKMVQKAIAMSFRSELWILFVGFVIIFPFWEEELIFRGHPCMISHLWVGG